MNELIADAEAVAADLNSMDWVLVGERRVPMQATIHRLIARIAELEFVLKEQRRDLDRLLKAGEAQTVDELVNELETSH